MNNYDVIIVGNSRVGGGTLARALAPSGKRILLLERGSWLTREPENWDAPKEVFVHNRDVSPDSMVRRARPAVFSRNPLLRWRSHEVVRGRALSTPEGGLRRGHPPRRRLAGMADHPLRLVEPYYTRAEQAYEVHGARGEDPTEPPASAPYPFPAVSH